MRLQRRLHPFDHNDWIFELKYDGFRALAYVEDGQCELVSRRSNVYKLFPHLCAEIAGRVKASSAVIDGEIVYPGQAGRPQFFELLRRNTTNCFFYAFDVLCIEDEDLRRLPLMERKRRLRRIIPKSKSARVRFLDHIEHSGIQLYEAACSLDLEGIVAKFKHAPYIADDRRSSWIKIKNPTYSQAEGRHELFEASGRDCKARGNPNSCKRELPGDKLSVELSGFSETVRKCSFPSSAVSP